MRAVGSYRCLSRNCTACPQPDLCRLICPSTIKLTFHTNRYQGRQRPSVGSLPVPPPRHLETSFLAPARPPRRHHVLRPQPDGPDTACRKLTPRPGGRREGILRVEFSGHPSSRWAGRLGGMGEASSRVFKVGDEVFGLRLWSYISFFPSSFPLFIIAYPFIKKPTRLTHAPWHRRNTPTSSPFPQTRTF
jgi:hypothetical protein